MSAVQGLVEDVDRERGTFDARLFYADKPDDVEWRATIRLRKVRPIERRLVEPGATFTIRRKRGVRMDPPRYWTAEEIAVARREAEETFRSLQRLVVWD